MKPLFEFVYVDAHGNVRELSILEKLELRTQYGFGDGARPFVKKSYDEKNGWGNLRGYCRRDQIPEKARIEDPVFDIGRKEIREKITMIKKMGYTINFDGLEEECGLRKE